MSFYKLVNTVNGKIYVGCTTRTLAARLSSHHGSARRKPYYPLYAAMHEYGFDVFVIELLEALPFVRNNDWTEREQFWIEHLHTVYPYGYNFDATSLKRQREKGEDIPIPIAAYQHQVMEMLARQSSAFFKK